MTFVKKLRDAASTCSNVDYRQMLRNHADRVSVSLTSLWEDATEENMQTLNGVWAAADAALKNMPPEGTPAPVSGSPEPARLAA